MINPIFDILLFLSVSHVTTRRALSGRTDDSALRKLTAFNWVPWVNLVWPGLDKSTCSLPVLLHIRRIMPGLAHQYL